MTFSVAHPNCRFQNYLDGCKNDDGKRACIRIEIAVK